jgi:hypothetical protein
LRRLLESLKLILVRKIDFIKIGLATIDIFNTLSK